MVKKVPTLSPLGFVTAIADKVNALMSYFYVSQYSQTTLYRGSVKPLAWLVQQYGNDPKQIQEQMQTTLQMLFGRYFDDATVSVITDVEDDRIKLTVTAMVRDGATEYNVGYVIRTSNAKVLDIFDLNNDGYILPNHQNTIK